MARPSINLRFGRHHRDMGLLYASRVAGVVVAVVFLPQYSRLLGPDQFGVAALVLSLQALLLMLDLGMSTLVGRDLADQTSDQAKALSTWRAAETILTLFYVGLAALVLLATPFFRSQVSWQVALCAVALFWLLTLQNVGQSALLARRDFSKAAVTQTIGVVVRAAVTLLVLEHLSATLIAFVVSQLSVAALHTWVTRRWCNIALSIENGSAKPQPSIRNVRRDLIRRGRPLLLFGIAGATVMQLDKVLVSALATPANVTPYYLATVFSMTPISLLAGPVSQFFQPLVFNTFSSENSTNTRRTLSRFVVTLTLFTGIPTAFIWYFRIALIDIWLRHSPLVGTVADCTAILLPGVALGAAGYVPYTLLVAEQDYKFQAWLSAALTIVTLSATAFFASKSNIFGVCWVYSAYHLASTLTSWIRAASIRGISSHARTSLLQWLAISATLFVGLAALTGIGRLAPA